MPNKTSPSINHAFEGGFSLTGKQLSATFLNTIYFFLLSLVLIITVIGILAMPALSGGYLQTFIRMGKGETVHAGDFIRRGFSRGWGLLGLSILYGLGVLIGLILFIIPGIYFAIRWYLAWEFYMADENCRIGEAFSRSKEATQGYWWKTCWLAILIGIITSLLSSTVIGMIIAVPLFAAIKVQYFLDADSSPADATEI